MNELYGDRRLAQRHPDMEKLYLDTYVAGLPLFTLLLKKKGLLGDRYSAGRILIQ
jgi:hypothetical protein